MVTYSFYNNDNLDDISNLLKSSNLPHADIRESEVRFIVARNNDAIIGCIGIEMYNTEGLLRSFAVSNALQNQGIGKELFNRLSEYCTQNGVKTLHLLTNTAKDYFLKKGFTVNSRTNAPYEIINTAEFESLCPSSSTYMVKQLIFQ